MPGPTFDLITYKYVGRKAFEAMVKELERMYEIAIEVQKRDEYQSGGAVPVPHKVIFETTYLLFFFGANLETMDLAISLWGENGNPFFTEVLANIQKVRRTTKARTTRGKWFLGSDQVAEEFIDQNGEFLPILFKLGVGHANWLSHYFRHLYHIVEYVDSQNDSLLSPSEKYKYVSSIRSQLSIHEQLLLFCNANSALGNPWLTTGLLEKYCLAKSIPLTMLRTYNLIDDNPTERNLEGRLRFEWLEIKERSNYNALINEP